MSSTRLAKTAVITNLYHVIRRIGPYSHSRRRYGWMQLS